MFSPTMKMKLKLSPQDQLSPIFRCRPICGSLVDARWDDLQKSIEDWGGAMKACIS